MQVVQLQPIDVKEIILMESGQNNTILVYVLSAEWSPIFGTSKPSFESAEAIFAHGDLQGRMAAFQFWKQGLHSEFCGEHTASISWGFCCVDK